MSPEAQRIAIAEACGWFGILESAPEDKRDNTKYPRGYLNSAMFSEPLPDYLSDLNAMHEAEKTLRDAPDGQCRAYADQFENLGPLKRSRFGMIHASAAERCENFLRVIGKWDASK